MQIVHDDVTWCGKTYEAALRILISHYAWRRLPEL